VTWRVGDIVEKTGTGRQFNLKKPEPEVFSVQFKRKTGHAYDPL
jgi:hypothetical protein